MKAVSLFSGGKDSFLASMIAMEQGYEIVNGITIVPDEYSMMFHYPNASMSYMASSLLNFNIEYVMEKNYENFINNISKSGVDAIITGAIASDYQKTRIEKLCYDSDIIVYSPLWRKKQEYIIEQILLRGIHAMIVSVSADGLGKEDLGSEINVLYYEHLKAVKEKYKINIAGEGGEYETFVFGIGSRMLEKIKFKKIWNESTGYMIIEN